MMGMRSKRKHQVHLDLKEMIEADEENLLTQKRWQDPEQIEVLKNLEPHTDDTE